CTVAPGTVNGTVISNTANVAVAGGSSDPVPGNNSANDTTTVIAGSGVSGTKTVAGSTIPGGAIVYTIILNNAGPGPQADNPGDEFIDVLPSQVTFDSASASSGTVSNAGNTVSWNGAIAASGSVTITINATVNAGAFGQINNQGTINYDTNGDGSNDASALTDNPAAPGAADPTGFLIAQNIPTLGPVGLFLLTIGLIAIWYRRERILRR
ncbi:MAG: DUF11 domain-containing protein, partial [Xanthomonadales bacterium]|nr:DUF11 domain-containing protein [Xanthomonadales bacterium]